MPPDSEKKIEENVSAEPPKIYITACGALCDIFWWARRSPSVTPPITASPGSKPETS